MPLDVRGAAGELSPPALMRIWLRPGEARLTLSEDFRYPQAGEGDEESPCLACAEGTVEAIPGSHDYGCLSASLRFNRATGLAEAPTARLFGERLSSASMEDVSERVNNAYIAMMLASALWRVAQLDPAQSGLLPHRVPASRRHPAPTSLLGSMCDVWLPEEEHCLTPVTSQLHPVWWETGWGWYSQAAPPGFATPYLQPFGNLEEVDLGEMPLSWGIYLTGLDRPLASARWDDVDALADLVHHVRTYDAETALAAYSLAHPHSDHIRESRQDFQYAQALAQARAQWRPGNKIRPVLASRAIAAAASDTGLDPRFIDTRTFGLGSKGDPDERLRDARDVVRVISFSSQVGSRQKEHFLARLDALCQAREIGTVLVGESLHQRQPQAYLVKDAAFFARYAPAFHCHGVESAAPAAGASR